MPSFNHERFIRDAINSVLMQTISDWELMIVDDCSSDKSKEVIQEWVRRDSRVRAILHSKNMGVSRTVNDGIEAAGGIYITVIASDDMFDPHLLERAVDVLESDVT